MNEYVLGFMYGPTGYVALVRKAKPDWQVNRLNGVGGKVEPSESPIEAMVRECAEETGIRTIRYNWRVFALMINSKGDRIHCFVCHLAMSTDLKLRGCEEEPVDWYSPRDLPGTVIPNVRWLIPLSQDSSAGFFTLDYRVKL